MKSARRPGFLRSRFGQTATTSVPSVTSFSPASGPPGTPVTISGSGLSTITNAQFVGISSPVTVVSDTQITTTVPSNAPTGSITVINTNGDEAISNDMFQVTAAMAAAPGTIPATTTTTTGATFTPGGPCASSTCTSGIYDSNGNCVCSVPVAAPVVPAPVTTSYVPGTICSTSTCANGIYDVNGNCVCSGTVITSVQSQPITPGQYRRRGGSGSFSNQNLLILGGLGLVILLLLFR